MALRGTVKRSSSRAGGRRAIKAPTCAMLFVLAQPLPAQTPTLQGIGSAFFATLDRDGGPAFALVCLLGSLAVVALLRWVSREARQERGEQEALDARHLAALADAADHDRRAWARVPAHVHLTVQHPDRQHHRFYYEDCETRSVSAGSLEYVSPTPPPSGAPLRLSLDLGDKWPLSLRGVVLRAAPVASGSSLVVVQLGPITPADREHLARWVTHEQVRELAQLRSA